MTLIPGILDLIFSFSPAVTLHLESTELYRSPTVRFPAVAVWVDSSPLKGHSGSTDCTRIGPHLRAPEDLTFLNSLFLEYQLF